MAIVHYERTYGTARKVLGIFEALGWCLVVLGGLLAVIGFSTGGLLSALMREPHFLARIVSALPGLTMGLSGLFSITYVQVSRANIDTAEMTREWLQIARRQELKLFGDNLVDENQSALSQISSAASKKEEVKAKPIELNETVVSMADVDEAYEYKGFKIFRKGKDFFVDGDNQEYVSLQVAKSIIDRM